MCSRFTLITSKSDLFNQFHTKAPKQHRPRYNISPGQQVLLFRPNGAQIYPAYVMWGIQLGKHSNLLFNARLETINERPLFIPLLTTGRCLVPASGWFFWKKEGEYKIPMYVSPKSGETVCFAGLIRGTKHGKEVVIITTGAEGEVGRGTDRMPFVLSRASETSYLEGADLQDLPRCQADLLTIHEVSPGINDPFTEGEEVIRPYQRSNEQILAMKSTSTKKRVVIDRTCEVPGQGYPEGLKIYTDGAARKNPGPASCAFIILDRNGRKIVEYAAFLGRATNNSAEYAAVIRALERAQNLTHAPIDLYSDSQLVIRQLTGIYQITKTHLAKSVATIRELERAFSKVTYHYLPRETQQISHCDGLCKRAIDIALSGSNGLDNSSQE